MLSRHAKSIIALGVHCKSAEFMVHIKQENFPGLENILPITKISLLLGKLPK